MHISHPNQNGVNAGKLDKCRGEKCTSFSACKWQHTNTYSSEACCQVRGTHYEQETSYCTLWCTAFHFRHVDENDERCSERPCSSTLDRRLSQCCHYLGGPISDGKQCMFTVQIKQNFSKFSIFFS